MADITCSFSSGPFALSTTTIKTIDFTGPVSKIAVLLVSGTSAPVWFTATRGGTPADPAGTVDEGYVAAVVGSYDEINPTGSAGPSAVTSVKVKGNGNTIVVKAIP